jgi:hypothetical protein
VAVGAINEAKVYLLINFFNNNDLVFKIQRVLEHHDLIRENRAFAETLKMMVEETTEEMEPMRTAFADIAKRIGASYPRSESLK